MKKTKTKITKDRNYYFSFPFKLGLGFVVVFGIIYVMPNLVNIIMKIYEEAL